MKKITIILLVYLLLVSCSSTNNKLIESEDSPITIDQIDYHLDYVLDGGGGRIWTESTYTNNSPYDIYLFDLEVFYKDTNDRGYFTSYDIVKPGETSPIFFGHGPISRNETHLENSSLLLIANIEGKEKQIRYNYKTDTYTVEDRIIEEETD